MLNLRLIAVLAGLLCLVLPSSSPGATKHESRGRKTAPAVGYESDILPLLKTYCFDCHGDGEKKGDLSLDAYTDKAAVTANRKAWEHILQNLRTSAMPPVKKKTQPTPGERARMVKWIEDELFPVDCGNPDPGRVTVRRLNRVEYNNTVRDLVGVDFQPADDFPQDDVGHGFDNIGDVLSLPPVLLEKYLAAADHILDEAIVTEDLTRRRTWRVDSESLEATAPAESRNEGWMSLQKEGELHTQVRLRASGEYVLRVRAAGEQAGPDPVKMSLHVDGADLGTIVVPERRREAKVHEVRFRADRGARRLAVRYLNNYFNADEKDARKRDRNLLVQYVEVEGPFDAVAQPLPETHRRIFVKAVKGGNGRDVAREILERFAARAWRRPVTRDEVSRLLALYDLGVGQKDSFEKSVKVALQAILVSPHFLFRGELQPEPDNPFRVHPVNEFALASRLSYFLWSTMPDEELSRLAASGKLRKNLDAQITRMLASPKSQAWVENFAAQWLQIRNLEIVNLDPKLFPEFTPELRRDFGQETRLFVGAILREDRSVLDLLDAEFSFLNARLAKVYGVPGVEGDEFRRVALAGGRRGGILTQGSVLVITSNPTRTSPVKRGKWVLENLLGAPPPPPPPNVPELKIDKDHPLTGTLRQKMEQHRANPACASCHDRMDAIGFAFENYNALGAWRTEEGGAPIEPAGELAPGEGFQGPAELKQILVSRRREEFVHCLTEKMMTYALGRGLEYYDRCAVNTITSNVASQGFRITAMIREIVQSAPFQMRRGEGDRLKGN